MPTISLTISAPDLTRTVDALAVRYGYAPMLPDGITPNPQTRGEFVRLAIARWVRAEVKAHELATAQAAVSVSEVSIT